jgi:hypothetical protein
MAIFSLCWHDNKVSYEIFGSYSSMQVVYSCLKLITVFQGFHIYREGREYNIENGSLVGG